MLMKIYWVKTHTVQENTEASSVSSKEVGLAVNAKKSKWIIIYFEQNHNINTDNKCFKIWQI
jgi:hypothetical protein